MSGRRSSSRTATAGRSMSFWAKLDFGAWLRSLPVKLRRIAKTLANGERTHDVARKFGVSDGRISQILRGTVRVLAPVHWRLRTAGRRSRVGVAIRVASDDMRQYLILNSRSPP